MQISSCDVTIHPDYFTAFDTFAHTLKDKFQHALSDILGQQSAFPLTNVDETGSENTVEDEKVDTLAIYKNSAIAALRNNSDVVAQLQSRGLPWGVLLRKLTEQLPDTLEDRDDVAYVLVAEALEQMYGAREETWHTFKRIGFNGKQTTWVKAGKKG